MTNTLTITDEPPTVEELTSFNRKKILVGAITTEINNAAIMRNEPWKRTNADLAFKLIFMDNSELEGICKKAGINI